MSSAAIDALADSIGNAKPGQGGVYFLPGTYPVLYIDKIQPQKNRHTEDMVVAEFDILESEVEERPAGSRVSQVYNLTKHRETAPGNVRAIIGASLGVSKDELDNVPEAQRAVISKVLGIPLTEKYPEGHKLAGALKCAAIKGEVVAKVLGSDNPAHGRLVRAVATMTKTKKEQKDFTLVDFTGLGEDVQALANDLRTAAGFPPI
jgi:hypothetical protein